MWIALGEERYGFYSWVIGVYSSSSQRDDRAPFGDRLDWTYGQKLPISRSHRVLR
jgi:hypothetical protein